MKKTKTLLIFKISNLKKEKIYHISKLPYTKIVLLYSWKDKQIKLPPNLSIEKYSNLIEIRTKINKIFKENPEYKILPNFGGDLYSKYSIKIFNKTFWTKVNSKIFKEKDEMTKFLWEIASKKYLCHEIKDLVKQNYEEIKNKLGENFIIKPINAASSVNTFKIRNNEDFENIKPRLSRKYNYIMEEYIWWNLFSLDFFFDWENMFLLVLVREIAMIELSDKNKFSNDFLEKYGDELNKYFNFILPLTYPVNVSKLSITELNFLEKIRKQLHKISYRWVIHLEYKYDSKTKKNWFVEWWARYWWYRKIFIKHIYNTDTNRLAYNLLLEDNQSKFTKIKPHIYKFREKEYNVNFVRVKTNFITNINYIEILKKSWNILEGNFSNFLKDYYKSKFSISVKKIIFFVKYSDNYDFKPFYKDNKTNFDYILQLDDENFSIFRKKKFKIIEKVFFHNYN